MFGEASPRGVGVFSFARYHPVFNGEPRTDEYEALVLRRVARYLCMRQAHLRAFGE